MGPLVVQLPADASAIAAMATAASGPQTALPTQAAVPSLRLAHGKRLRPERNAQFVLIRWPRALASGDYELTLTFTTPEPRPIREKVMYTASVSCGRSSYLQPILPPVAKIARAPTLTLRPPADAVGLQLPRLAPGIRSYVERKRTISCVR